MNNLDGKLNHWDMAILKLLPEIKEAYRMSASGPVTVSLAFPSAAPGEECVLRIQYVHPQHGFCAEEIILLRDGTWRYLPWHS